MRSIVFVIFIICVALGSYGQTMNFKYRVKIPSQLRGNNVVKRIDTVKDKLIIPKGEVISNEQKINRGGKEFILKIFDTIKRDTTILIRKEIHQVVNEPGTGTISFDKNDKSKLYINYWLNANRQANAVYYFQLENRDWQRFWFKTVELGALTIPFKYRPGFTEKNIKIEDDLTADLNVGTFLGFSTGQITYKYRRHEEVEPTKWMVSAGPFISISRVEIDSTKTLTATNPMKSKKAIATFFSRSGYNDFYF